MEFEYNFFAYDVAISQKKMKRIIPKAVPMYKAKIFGARLEFIGHLNLKQNKGRKTYSNNMAEGVLYRIKDSDLQKLDQAMKCPEKRRRVWVYVEDVYGNPIQAFTYVLAKRSKVPILPTHSYFQKVHDGYVEWNLNDYYLIKAWDDVANKLNIFKLTPQESEDRQNEL